MLELGQIILTLGAKAVLAAGESEQLLERHLKGDYGNVSLADAALNDFAVEDGGRPIISRYRTRSGHEVLVVTNRDTRIALPQEL